MKNSMDENNKPDEIKLFKKIFGRLKSKPKVKVGYLGVYHYTLSIYADTKALHNVKYDIFVKVKATFVYNNLVEVECVGEPTINDSITPEMASIILKSVPKYLEPDKVKWQVEN
jgi:hypothetical protein